MCYDTTHTWWQNDQVFKAESPQTSKDFNQFTWKYIIHVPWKFTSLICSSLQSWPTTHIVVNRHRRISIWNWHISISSVSECKKYELLVTFLCLFSWLWNTYDMQFYKKILILITKNRILNSKENLSSHLWDRSYWNV